MLNKLRTIKILEILKNNSDEEHCLSISDINAYLESDGYDTCNRKTIYSDIKSLNEVGFQIETIRKNNNVGYYYANHIFEKAELRILADLLVSTNFVTEKKTKEMIDKLLNQTSKTNRNNIERTLSYSAVKSDNEKIYYNVDAIQNALENDLAITFDYFDINEEGVKKYRNHNYCVIPYALVINDGKYYCIVYTTKYDRFINYRIDKMEHIEVVDNDVKRKPFNINKEMSAMFSMYSTDKKQVELKCASSINMSLLDKFSDNMIITQRNNDYFVVNALVSVSNAFYGWLFQCGDVIELIGDESVRKDYLNYLKTQLRKYEG